MRPSSTMLPTSAVIRGLLPVSAGVRKVEPELAVAGRRHAEMPISSREMKCQCAASTGVIERRLPRRSSSIPANCG